MGYGYYRYSVDKQIVPQLSIDDVTTRVAQDHGGLSTHVPRLVHVADAKVVGK